MWLFIWKKYEFSAVATAISAVGNIAIVFAAILLGMGLAALNGVLGIVGGIAGYVALRILLNKLTDRIAKVDMNASVHRYLNKSAKEEAKQKVKDEELIKAMTGETDQDALYKAIHDSFHQSIKSRITLEQKFSAAQRLDDAHVKKLLESCSGCFNYNRFLQKKNHEKGVPLDVSGKNMVRMIGFIKDEAERDRLMKY